MQISKESIMKFLFRVNMHLILQTKLSLHMKWMEKSYQLSMDSLWEWSHLDALQSEAANGWKNWLFLTKKLIQLLSVVITKLY